MFKNDIKTYTNNMSFPEYLNEHIKNKEDLIRISDTIYGLASRIEAQKKDDKKTYTMLLITGLPGAGKDSVAQQLIEKDKRFGWIKTCTTRSIRPEEVENDPYVRLTEDEFQKAQGDGDVIESVLDAGTHYCSLGSLINKAFEDFDIPILRINPEGAATYSDKWKNEENVFDKVNLICVFVAPRSMDDLRVRLFNRSGGDEKFVEKKIAQAILDLGFINETEYIVINETGKLEMAVDDVASLIS